MQNIELKAVLRGVRPGGCVQPYLAGFAAEIASAGYAALSLAGYMRSAAHLGRWMDSQNIGISQLNEAAIGRFVRHTCQCPGASRHGYHPSRRTVAPYAGSSSIWVGLVWHHTRRCLRQDRCRIPWSDFVPG